VHRSLDVNTPAQCAGSPVGVAIDYHAAVAGGPQLVPDDGALAKLAADYQQMVDDGLFLDDAEPFEALLDQCRTIKAKANAIRSQK